MSQGMYLAKALYDNVAETPDELAFRKGDVLTVLEKDTRSIDGWWLCSLKGKTGIAPGNRLKILSGIGESPVVTPVVDGASKRGADLYRQPIKGQQDYDVPPSSRSIKDIVSPARRPSYDALRNFAASRSASLGDDLYDTPPSSKRGSAENAAGIYDTPPSSKRASSERTPPHSNRSSASRDSASSFMPPSTPSQLAAKLQQSDVLGLPTVVRRRHESSSSSSENYETSGSNRSSLERILSEEGPPIYESVSPATSFEQLDTGDPTYDVPPSRPHVLSQANPASQTSLGSAVSSESLLSNTSSLSGARVSQTASLPDSARSSMDLPSEAYDVPPAVQEGDRSRKQLSVDSGLGFYDSPVRSRPSSSTSNSVIFENLKTSQSFDLKPSPSPKDMKRSKSLENSVDDCYDTPRSNAPKINLKKQSGVVPSCTYSSLNEPSGVYDIPPQVTRDSVISMRSDSSDEYQRLSSSSLDMEQQLANMLLWDELLLDLDSALELLVKRQQDVFKATSRLTSFVNSTWRSRSCLEKTLYDIKVSCTLVKNSLHDFVEFAHGATANAIRLPDQNLASRLQKYVSPLQSTLDLVKKSFVSLEEMKWQVSLLSEPLDPNQPDYLGQIALSAKDLTPEVKKAASFIQSYGPVLFKKSAPADSRKPAVSSKPPIVPKPGDGSGGKGPGYGYGKAKNMQHRPLPAVPNFEKNLPGLADKAKLSMYDIKAALHKDDYAECDELPSEKDWERAHRDIMEQCIQEYDYVQLDSRDTPKISQSKSAEQLGETYIKSSQDKTDAGSKDSHLISPDMKSKDIMAVRKSVDNDVELIPVKDGANRNKEASNVITEEKSEATFSDISDPELTEQDLKTPVNSSPSAVSSFILPAPETGNNENESLDPNDRQVLVYYTEQMNSHSTLLANAIDAFIAVVGSKEPPNVFISHSKFVIVSAHKLVHIGDSIHRNLLSNIISMRIMQCANHLCDCLKASVTATKTAALQYPSAPAIQEMVDQVIAVSHAAHELRLVITQAAKL